MLEALLARTMEGLPTLNTLVTSLLVVRLRFQIAPGTASDLGIANVPYSLLSGGTQFETGQTDANGEVAVPLSPLLTGSTIVVRIFGTDYDLSLHAGLQAINGMNGRQKRLDVLGYMTGYQLTGIANAVPDDGNDGPRTQQSIMNLQTDQNLTIDGDIGPQTTNALRAQTGE